MISPIPAEARFVTTDMPWVAGTALGLALVAAVLGTVPRLAGAGLLAIYAAYIALMV
jgi:hypothetical protein